MPRSRGSTEIPQKQSPRAPLHLKTTAHAEANGAHRSSPKLEDRRSARSPLQEKKRGTRVAELESKLGQAQDELKKLKEQLALAEAEKLDAQRQLQEAKKQASASPSSGDLAPDAGEKPTSPEEQSINTTDVFVVITESSSQTELTQEKQESEKDEEMTKPMIEEEKTEDNPESREISELRAMLAEKEKLFENLKLENDSLKPQVAEVAAAQAKEEELSAKLGCMGEELDDIRVKAEKLKELLEAAEKGKVTLEAELRRLKIQTEQWRKAAETAAAVLANDDGMMVEMNGRRVAERFGSMEKHFGGFVAGMESPEDDEVFGVGGKRKGGGMRMFGDLWKKKGQHK